MLDGHANPHRLLERAKELGMPAIAQTDHGNIHGWLDFYEAAQDVGVKPVLGIESYQSRKTRHDRDEEERSGKAIDELEQRGPYHLTILARNMAGYRNLIKLSSKSFLEGFYVKPRVDHELLAEHGDGLIILSGCLNGEICQALMRGDMAFALKTAQTFQDIVGRDHFYIEVMDHGLPEQHQVTKQLLEIAKIIGAKVVPTADCHYVNKEDAHAHDVMLCVATHAKVSDENRFKFYNDEFYLKSYDEMSQLFPEEWLKNSLDVADQVDLELKFGEIYFPEFPKVPEGMTTDSYLEEQVREGLHKRYGAVLPEDVRDRATYEFDVVKRMGFQSYFLVVSDLVGWAKDNGILTGWGRGSAAGCILSYALGITDLDPLRFGLLFERFLVEGRKSMPDIDLDFDDRYRDRVINYGRETYGDDRVAHICTFSSVKSRQAIRDAAMALGYEYADGDRVAKLVPPPVLGVSKTLDECMETEEFSTAYKNDKVAKHIIDTAFQLEGLIRQTGIHAAGVVIAQAPVTEFIPVMRRPVGGKMGPITTQWDMHYVELCGMLKIDFLGIRNLAVITECVNNLKASRGIDVNVKDIPLDDVPTYQALAAGQTVGVFQLESAGMRDMTVDIQPNCIEDIMTIITLYRPGPLNSGADKMYINRRKGKERVSYPHPKFEELLSENYGLMLYQEDVLAMARQLAGFSAGEADDLRKAIGKKQMDKIGKFREKFVQGCKEHSDVEPSIANKIYSDIEYFGGYGFNRAHAASYAMVSYVTAYLKVNYPAEYMAALVSSVTEPERMRLYLNECRRMGLTVHPPAIGKSKEEFTVLSEDEILFGIRSIVGVGETMAPRLAVEAEYSSVYDFLRKTDLDAMNSKVFEHLVYSGTFDELVDPGDVKKVDRDLHREFLEAEHARLASYIIEHPVWSVRYVLQEAVEQEIHDLQTFSEGSFAKVGGLVTKIQPIITKKGDKMYRFELEDLTAAAEVVMFPRETKKFGHLLEVGSMVVMTGRVQHEGHEEEAGVIKLFVTELERLEVPSYSVGEPIRIVFKNGMDHSILEAIESLIEANPGDSPVFVEVREGRHSLKFQFKKPTSLVIKDEIETLVHLSQGVTNALS